MKEGEAPPLPLLPLILFLEAVPMILASILLRSIVLNNTIGKMISVPFLLC
jgi:hypothetical protein